MKLADLLICRHPFSPGSGYQAGPVWTPVLFLGLPLAWFITSDVGALDALWISPLLSRLTFGCLASKFSGVEQSQIFCLRSLWQANNWKMEKNQTRAMKWKRSCTFSDLKKQVPAVSQWSELIPMKNIFFFWTIVWMERLWLYNKNRQEELSL